MKNSVIPACEISSDVFASYLLQLSDKVKNNSMELAILEQSVKESKTRNLFLENVISEKDRNISGMKTHIKNLEAVIDVNKREFAGIKEELSIKNMEIQRVENVVSELNNEIKDLKLQIHAKDAEIKNLKTAASFTTYDRRFTDNGDGTVTDNKTSLMWKKYPEGASRSNDYSGISEKFTWDKAIQRAAESNRGSGFAGYKDWRLPDIDELKSIIDKKFTNPCINHDAFPDTPPASFWSSSPDAANGANAWIIGFFSGSDFPYCKHKDYYVRLVRFGQ